MAFLYPWGNTQQLNLDWILQKIKELEAGGGADLDEVANALISASYARQAYDRSDIVFYNGKLYRANQAIPAPGETWTPAHWDEILLGDTVSNIVQYVAALSNDQIVNISNVAGTHTSDALDNLNGTLNAISNPFTAYNQSGKHLWIYRFGGGGNNWCWVRTPTSYDPQRKTKFPFVVCNHGNNWVMDGTEQYANYTKRTMYVPLDDPDYINNPTQYNGTSDSSLWYSNPTIEALLAADYVVCGAENYGDALYGNTNCRNACVHFINHMIDVYNVEHMCSMIGVSAGALTSLNAAYIAPDKVKSIILQYPVTCLVNQYDSNSGQRASIRSAYGISDAAITLEDLATVVATHDPLTSAVVNGIRSDNLPPIKIWYSTSDTTAVYTANTMPLYNLLKTSNKICELVQASGQHGDYTHFDPAATVAWFNNPESTVSAYSTSAVKFYNLPSLITGVTIHAYKIGNVGMITIQAASIVNFSAGWNNLSSTLPEELRSAYNNPPTNTTYDEMRNVFKAGTAFGIISVIGGTLRLNFSEAIGTTLIASVVYPLR